MILTPALTLLAASPVTIVVQTALVMILAFLVLAGIASFLRYQSLSESASANIDTNELSPEVAYKIKLANFLGSVHREPEPFFIAAITLQDQEQKLEQFGADGVDDLYLELAERLRQNVRKEDTVLAYAPQRIGLALRVPRANARRILDRILGATLRESFQISGSRIKLSLHLGVVTFPENGVNVGELQTGSEQAVQQARLQNAPLMMGPLPPGVEEPEPAENSIGVVAGQEHLLDQLTGVLRPDRVGPAMTKYVARFRKDDKDVSMLYIDVDGLDRYNDHYSRQAGDTILRKLGELLQRGVREEDLIGRIENDEFVVVMGCDHEAAMSTAQRLALEIKTTKFVHGNTNLRLTVCIGMSNYPKFSAVARHMFAQAEHALKAAKLRGKNQCMMFDPSMVAPKRSSKKVDAL